MSDTMTIAILKVAHPERVDELDPFDWVQLRDRLPIAAERISMLAAECARTRPIWRELWELREALDGGARPMCRDCADNDGICDSSGLPCDPHQRALEQIRRLRAATAEVE